MTTPEKRVQNSVVAAFGTRNDMRLWRANAGVASYGYGKNKRKVRYGVPGQADLTGILSDGRRLEIETKSAKGTLSDEQKNYRAIIERFGGLYIVARSVQDVTDALKREEYL